MSGFSGTLGIGINGVITDPRNYCKVVLIHTELDLGPTPVINFSIIFI